MEINQAYFITPDIEAFNGVIHVIDQVILPEDGFSDISVSKVVKAGKATVDVTKWSGCVFAPHRSIGNRSSPMENLFGVLSSSGDHLSNHEIARSGDRAFNGTKRDAEGVLSFAHRCAL